MLIFVRNWLSLKCYIDIINSVKKMTYIVLYIYGIRDKFTQDSFYALGPHTEAVRISIRTQKKKNNTHFS